MNYLYRCPDCGREYEVEHSIKECDTAQVDCLECNPMGTTCHRVFFPVRHVGQKVKPSSAEVNAYREHCQQMAIDKKRRKRK